MDKAVDQEARFGGHQDILVERDDDPAGFARRLAQERNAEALLADEPRWVEAVAARKRKRYSAARRTLKDLRNAFSARLEAPAGEDLETLQACLVLIERERAQSIYQNPNIHPTRRFEKAAGILAKIRRKPFANDAETLRLLGAVAKRRWMYGGQYRFLQEAISLYREAVRLDPQADQGYGATNAAYLLLYTAEHHRTIARRAGIRSTNADRAVEEAVGLCRATKRILSAYGDTPPDPSKVFWHWATLATALFILQEYRAAQDCLERAREAGAAEHDLQTTFQQIVRIAKFHGAALPSERAPISEWHEAWQAVSHLMASDAAERTEKTRPALCAWRGKVGLALSGGGFRAALYQLGALARLAEVDALRCVEAISTVSGGSVVGALYYLEIRALLSRTPDAKITREDYVDLVHRVIKIFLAGVQKNIRNRAFTNLLKSIALILASSQSITNRIGSLYQKFFYDKATLAEGESRAPRLMTELKIKPVDAPEPDRFHPSAHNWSRAAKAPVFIVNTTSLNSGHNWRFTATWMGEPPGASAEEVDKNQRYPWNYYEKLPEGTPPVRLGDAIAASSCVPGLFEPLPLHDGLYQGDRLVRLVDGGVHDNQGIQGLMDEGCTVILCIDSSGQMGDVEEPADTELGVLFRSNSIMMDRIRETQFADLRARLDSGALSGLLFVHLKQGLNPPSVYWGQSAPSEEGRTRYGIDVGLQLLLSRLRTDLDSFTEVEAYALMASGYLATKDQIENLQAGHDAARGDGEETWCDFRVDAASGAWPFLDPDLLEAMAKPENVDRRRDDLGHQLAVGRHILFRSFLLVGYLKPLMWLAFGLGAAGAIALAFTIDMQWLGALGVVFLAAIYFILGGINRLRPEGTVKGAPRKLAFAAVAWIACNLAVQGFDRALRKRGRLEELKKL